MILPSISDAGSDKVVISPFTSLLSNVISKAKDSAGLVEDLTVAEGCPEAGDSLATKVSSELTTISTIESATGVTTKTY